MMPAHARDELRRELRDWLAANLPAEWRDATRHVPEADLTVIRRAWGERLGRGGWAAPSWPSQWGGRDLPPDGHAIVLEELVRSGAPDTLNGSPITIFGPMLLQEGTERQKERYLRRMLDHSEIWCQGFSEPDAGSDLASLRSTLTPDGNDFRVSGQKLWTSHGHHADQCFMLVRSDREAPKHAGISLVIVAMDQPGVTVKPLRNIAGTMHFSEVFFDDAVVTADDVIGPLNEGWRIATQALGHERGVTFAPRVFLLGREIDEAVTLLATRTKDLSDADSSFARRLSELALEHRALTALVGQVLERTAAGKDAGILPSIVKLRWSEAHQRTRDLVLEILADDLLTPEAEEQITRYLYARSATIYAGTSEVQRNLIARALGLPGSRGGS